MAATRHFNHPGKLKAIIRSAEIIADTTFDLVRERLISNPVITLRQFPYLGPATSCHLAKNLGFMIPKPDRHLRRIAEAAGHSSVIEFCEVISLFVGDSVSKVDTVFWRYATMYSDYLVRLFGGG